MRNRWRARSALLGTYVLLIAGVAAVVPGLGGSSGEPVEAAMFDGTGTVTINGTSITYSGATESQDLANGQGCTLSTGMAFLEFSGSKAVGLVDGSIGIKSKGNGQDCGQIDGPEVLEVSLGSDPEADGQAIYKAELDLEVLQDAGLTLTAYFDDGAKSAEVGTFRLLTGTRAPSDAGNTPSSTTDESVGYCNPASSSGPNSAENDNCYWTIISDSPFNRFTIAEDFDGKVSLQGGDDWEGTGDGGPTVLYLTDAPDGILACGDTVQAAGGTADLDGVITRLGDAATDPDCELKPYNFQVEGSVVQFEPEGGGARYSGVITKVVDEGTITGNPDLTVDWIEYDKDGGGDTRGFVPMQWCDAAPQLDDDGSVTNSPLPSTTDTDTFDATWCVYGVNLSEPDGTSVTAAFWVYGQDDPHWR